MTDVRVMIAVPTQDTWKATFGQCLMACLTYTQRHIDGEVSFVQEKGTILNDMRTHLAEHAVRSDATHIMCFDNDMTFPPDTIMRLLAHGKAIAAANYPQRRRPVTTTAKTDDNMSVFYTDHMSTGLEPARSCGMGVMLIETSVFKRMSRPWFNGGDVGERLIGEDNYFCYKARQELDEPVWIDQDLSKLIGHIGEHIYTFEDALKDRVQVRMIKAGEIPSDGEVLPHEHYAEWVDLYKRIDPDELRQMTEAYRQQTRAREDAQEADARRKLGLDK